MSPGRGAACAAFLAGSLAGCHLSPPPPAAPGLRAASSSAYVVNVEFDTALDRAGAEDPSHYSVTPEGPGEAPRAILSATVLDTLYGRTVQLVIPDGLPDSTTCTLTARDVRALGGASLGTRTVTFLAGLGYARHMRPLFAARCDACHGDVRADAGYRTDSLDGLRGGGKDTTPNLEPGNPSCLLVRRTQPGHSMFDRASLTFLDAQMIQDWVVSYQARP